MTNEDKRRGLKRPNPLIRGDKVAILAPSSPVPAKVLTRSIESIKFLGLEPVIYPSCMLSHGYLSGTDEERALDINTAFADPTIKGIFCLRGGYGATRILTMLNYPMITKNPKLFAGYSDITALHLAFNKLCGFITFHSPMPNTGYAKMDEFSLNSLRENLFSNKPLGLAKNPMDEILETIWGGKTEGMITGGNLSLLQSTLGSPFEMDSNEKIIFIEDVGERPYRLDKALTALALAGKFKDCAGIILGTFAECEEPTQNAESTDIAAASLSLEEIFTEVIKPFHKPTLLNFRAGHIYPQSTIPMGAYVKLDADQRTIEFA